MHMQRSVFLELSSELSGYPAIDLEGTGLADQYLNLVNDEIGEEVSEILFSTVESVLKLQGKARDHAMVVEISASPLIWPVCQSIVALWYLGQWTRMSANWYSYYAGMNPPVSSVDPGKSFVPSAQAYTEQLSYRGAGAHPPGAHPTGFGSWGLDPLFGDFTIDNKKS
jgi:hypothetical protein